MGRNDEATEQIDIEALRRSMAEAQSADARPTPAEPPLPPPSSEELESLDLIEDVDDEVEELEPLEVFDLPPARAAAPSVPPPVPASVRPSVRISIPPPPPISVRPPPPASLPPLASVEIDIAGLGTVTAEQPHATVEQSQVADEQPQVTAEQPQVTVEQPQATVEQPQATAEQPEPFSEDTPLTHTIEETPLVSSVEAAATPQVTVLDPTPVTTSVAPVAAGGDVVIDEFASDVLDTEEEEHHRSGSFASLATLYRARIDTARSPRDLVSHLLKLADIYETRLGDQNAAFETLVSAFKVAPDSPRVVTAIDRVGKQVERIGELAEKVRREFLPKAPDDQRVVLLTHIVYWYERVLGRGREVGGFVAEIGRYDKNHPILLKRAAQLAELNGDIRGQREQLVKALERTMRSDERLSLLLTLAKAYEGTTEELKYFEAAVEVDPKSLVALQGLARVAKANNKYDQVRWVLGRQIDFAETNDVRVAALLELAELEETKFLKRDIAAALLERVIELEPSHPAALEALERCYRALRNWPKLVDVLLTRAAHSRANTETPSKIELLELAAEVFESKLADPDGAIRTYQSLLTLAPKHRRALADLARIFEKRGDWANFARYKAEVAELAPTPRASAQELLKLGEFLNAPERNPDAAKRQYERAVIVDPTYGAAWEALQKVAMASGDVLRLVEYLEERAKQTDVPRQRANVYVEIAKIHRDRGDEQRARLAFENAVEADPSNEMAAAAVLDGFVEQQRWADAQPLCELLVNAAIRDRDSAALFGRLRLVTKIATALGDGERAVSAAVVALEASPDDAGARDDLIVVASNHRHVGSLERARPHLLRIAETSDDLTVDQLRRLANLHQHWGDVDSATSMLERVKQLSPDDREVTTALVDLYLARDDFARACKMKIDMARAASDPNLRFELLCEVGEIWARRAEELEKAASVYDEAKAIKPLDPKLLQTLMWLYGELGQWDQLSTILDDLSKVQDDLEDKTDTLLSMARLARDKLDDRLRAADIYDRVLDENRRRLDVFEELVRVLTEDKAWERLELAYRRMLERIREDDEAHLRFLLFHQLGLIYRDRLGDASRAFDALEEAGRLRPDNVEIRKSLTELLIVTDNLDNAVARLRTQIHATPHDAALYEELYELFLRQHAFDKAWCAVDVFARLGKPNPEQRRFHEDFAPMPLDRVPGQIVEHAWRSHLTVDRLDPELTRILALVAAPYARMRTNQLRPEQRLPPPFTPHHSQLYDDIRRAFDDVGEILGIRSPELLLAEGKSATPFSASFMDTGTARAILVSPAAVDIRARSLVYLVGEAMAEQRPDFVIRSLVPTVADLTALLHAAVRVSRNEPPGDGASLDHTLAAALNVQEAATLRSAVAHADGESTFDVEAWARDVDLSTMRAGLLVSGTVEQGAQAIMAETSTAGSMVPRDKLGELYKFATSDLYADLRGAIGVTVQG